MWWVWTPHEGGRQSNSPAQQQMVDLANITHHLTPLERKEASLAIWNHEKGLAAAVIILSWCFKASVPFRVNTALLISNDYY